ncbi:MAG: DNA gyrase inhibitor YacG [Planctomycetota bacterium]|nr:DNA gyrase inhibitor YacG [Planctomycetota bacterium]
MPQKQGQVNPGKAEKCRYCGRSLNAADPEHKRFWPFCSDRCKMAELGLWFEDRYRISREVDEVADDAGAKPPETPKGGR